MLLYTSFFQTNLTDPERTVLVLSDWSNKKVIFSIFIFSNNRSEHFLEQNVISEILILYTKLPTQTQGA